MGSKERSRPVLVRRTTEQAIACGLLHRDYHTEVLFLKCLERYKLQDCPLCKSDQVECWEIAQEGASVEEDEGLAVIYWQVCCGFRECGLAVQSYESPGKAVGRWNSLNLLVFDQ